MPSTASIRNDWLRILPQKRNRWLQYGRSWAGLLVEPGEAEPRDLSQHNPARAAETGGGGGVLTRTAWTEEVWFGRPDDEASPAWRPVRPRVPAPLRRPPPCSDRKAGGSR